MWCLPINWIFFFRFSWKICKCNIHMFVKSIKKVCLVQFGVWWYKKPSYLRLGIFSRWIIPFKFSRVFFIPSNVKIHFLLIFLNLEIVQWHCKYKYYFRLSWDSRSKWLNNLTICGSSAGVGLSSMCLSPCNKNLSNRHDFTKFQPKLWCKVEDIKWNFWEK